MSDDTPLDPRPEPSDDEPLRDPAEFTDDDFWLDAGPGHGAQSTTEDWVRANSSPASNDGRSRTRTTFYAWDVDTEGPGQRHRDPEDRRSWEDLATWNDGKGAGYGQATLDHHADRRRWVETFGGQLGCSRYQIDQTKYVVDRVDIGPFQARHVTSEELVLGVLSLLIDADATKSGEFDNRAVARDSMKTLMSDLEMDRSDLREIRKLLRENEGDLLWGE